MAAFNNIPVRLCFSLVFYPQFLIGAGPLKSVSVGLLHPSAMGFPAITMIHATGTGMERLVGKDFLNDLFLCV